MDEQKDDGLTYTFSTDVGLQLNNTTTTASIGYVTTSTTYGNQGANGIQGPNGTSNSTYITLSGVYDPTWSFVSAPIRFGFTIKFKTEKAKLKKDWEVEEGTTLSPELKRIL